MLSVSFKKIKQMTLSILPYEKLDKSMAHRHLKSLSYYLVDPYTSSYQKVMAMVVNDQLPYFFSSFVKI